MNVFTSRWEDTLLEACGGTELRGKLRPEPVLGGSALGEIRTWWVQHGGSVPVRDSFAFYHQEFM